MTRRALIAVAACMALAAPATAGAADLNRGLGHMTISGTYGTASASGDTPDGVRIARLWVIEGPGGYVVNYDYIATCTTASGGIAQRSGSGTTAQTNTRYTLPAPIMGATTCSLEVTAQLDNGGNAELSIGYSTPAPRPPAAPKPPATTNTPCVTAECGKINDVFARMMSFGNHVSMKRVTRAAHELVIVARRRAQGLIDPTECRAAIRELTHATKRKTILSGAASIQDACS